MFLIQALRATISLSELTDRLQMILILTCNAEGIRPELNLNSNHLWRQPYLRPGLGVALSFPLESPTLSGSM